MQIFLDEEGFAGEKDSIELIKETVDAAARLHSIADDVSVSITLVDEAEIQEINRDYRGVDKVTDVISFALSEGDEPEITGGGEELLGEIVICLEVAIRQAEEYGHSAARELSYLTAHGMLHLLGYDHIDDNDKAIMRVEEEKIMKAMGLER